MMMTGTLIRATAEKYTEARLVELRDAALEDLERLDAVVSASTGGGTSYTKERRMRADEVAALYQAALDYKRGCAGEGDWTQRSRVVF